MRGLIRALIAAASVAAGSWVGLHPRTFALPAKPAPAPVEAAPVATMPASGAADASDANDANDANDPRGLVPPDTAVAAGPMPWPRLNPEANIMKAWRLAEGPHRQPGDMRRLVTLTFDDGPFPETTPKVLELLAKYQVHATFFVIGRYLDGDGDRARASRDVMKQIALGGHLIGNHTHDHALLTAVSHTQVLEQIDRGAASIERATGKKPLLFRPPFGELDDFGQDAVRARQLDVLLWNIEAKDMERDDTAGMFQDLVRQLRYNEGGIVLLHDIRWTSVNILKRLLAYLDARRYDANVPSREGYEIVDLPTYLREVEASPPQPGARDTRALTNKVNAARSGRGPTSSWGGPAELEGQSPSNKIAVKRRPKRPAKPDEI